MRRSWPNDKSIQPQGSDQSAAGTGSTIEAHKLGAFSDPVHREYKIECAAECDDETGTGSAATSRACAYCGETHSGPITFKRSSRSAAKLRLRDWRRRWGRPW